MSGIDPVEHKRLRWRCRRGMRELDQLMLRFLDRAFETASEVERALFLRLLDTEDDILWRWCMGRERPEDPDLAGFIDRLLRLPP
ncbi:succinate dehydrogenase assembly factor 2 [Silanimonas sp.]|uniref:FAD assembly factor SdhE n=1 Tax=Silanimonas sp. TaxID=1929290 RepID=UPI001BC2E7AB|nr:succinate dehydrogenase assembly factor 2 [Silanimonas sp.]MBS3896611.1 succinate dehydrogenase assembly factor 2 [Silanimonas sp.]MBS3923920.1 succinate dehydrogenase assembly factor 2 [Xanthomonadaceae bacterium]